MLRAAVLATVAALLAAAVALLVTEAVLAPDELPAVQVDAPDGPSRSEELSAEDACVRLASRLPDELAGLPRRGTSPPGVRVAAWGDPPVVLRCGVDEPEGYSPTADVVEVGGVLLHPGPLPDGSPGATVVDRPVFVEVALPEDVDPAVVYQELARVVDETLPPLRAGGVEVPVP